MKKSVLLLVFLLFLPMVAANDWVFNSEYLDISLDVSSKITIVPTSLSYSVDYVVANLSFVPEDGLQEEVLRIETEPRADIEDGVAVFRWDDPDEKELRFNVESDVRSFNKVVKIKNKVNFPLRNVPDDVLLYTGPSKSIDSDDKDIIKLASGLIEGEDDLYKVVFKLGDWTKTNIEYDLSTLTESISQPASWVLNNKQGVCDELTNLFIAMCRSLEIPAKFISGVSYSNADEFGEGFGAHGWAEVYFPGYGWVPFDVTFGEFGFVDAGHIKLKEGLDADDASIKYQWLGRKVNVISVPLDIKAEVKEIKGKINDMVDIDARAVKDNLGFGSYNIIKATIENVNDYYLAVSLRLSRSKEIEIVGDEEMNLLLKPNEEKDVDWIVEVSDNLERGYIYTFPFLVSSVRNVSSEARFDVTEDGKMFSLEGMESLVEGEEEEKSLLGNVEVSCSVDKEGVYDYETANVECNVKNIGNIYLEDLNVCLEDDCEKVSLGITQEDDVKFVFKPKESGMQEIVIKASNAEVNKNHFLDISVYDKPVVEINELENPTEVRYKDVYEISFVLDKKSKFAPSNVVIKIVPLGKEWELNELSESRKFVLKMFGSELDIGKNVFKIFVEYKDKNGKKYETSEDIVVSLVDVNIFQRISIFFKGIGRRIMGVFR